MTYTKTILCLANSWKHSGSQKRSGRCIAGKEFDNGKIGSWIRPVSARPSEEISEKERHFENGGSPKVLDVIHVPMIKACPKLYQSENHLIDDNSRWAWVRQGTWKDALAAVDPVKGSLWSNLSSSHNGINDRVPEATANALIGSLFLIQPEELEIQVAEESAGSGKTKRKVRASFTFNNSRYKLAVTDLVVGQRYLQGKNGTYPIKTALLCVSLSKSFENYAYKLVAAVITPDAGG